MKNILNLDYIMQEKEITNAQLVRLTKKVGGEISSANISNYRRGLSQPNATNLALLSLALNVEPTDLINFSALVK